MYKLKNLNPRVYQSTILNTAKTKNTLVVLPTGLGKTAISLMLSLYKLQKDPGKRIVLLAPTKPLLEQHKLFFKNNLNISDEELTVFTGLVKPKDRAELFIQKKIIFSTPQCLENDVIEGRIDLSQVSLIIFDEAHRAVGNYAYVFVAKQFNSKNTRGLILGLTASPGSDKETIRTVLTNLYIEKIECRSIRDPDVREYVQKTRMRYLELEFEKNFEEVRKLLQDIYKEKIEIIKNYNITTNNLSTKTQILIFQRELSLDVSRGGATFEKMHTLSLLAMLLKIQHGIELLETQGIFQVHEYLSKIKNEAKTSSVRAVQVLAQDSRFCDAITKVELLKKQNFTHPKFKILSDLVASWYLKKKETQKKLIIFTQYRTTANLVSDMLNKLGVANNVFFGQSSKANSKGLNQKEQMKVLEAFRNNEFSVLIATSVAEEGLDIPNVDRLVFFEPVPSVIRTIQRRGRTGRFKDGEIYCLVTKGTRDSAYRFSILRKEKNMYGAIRELEQELDFQGFIEKKSKNTSLDDFSKFDAGFDIEGEVNDAGGDVLFSDDDLGVSSDVFVDKKLSNKKEKEKKSNKIIVDDRERSSNILKQLVEKGIEISVSRLTCGDYLISNRVAVELKTKKDFVDSIIDGRLLSQLKKLKTFYERPVLIIQGEEDIYSVRNVHPNSIRGVITAITLSFNIPILFTTDTTETAEMLYSMIARENNFVEFDLSHSKKPIHEKVVQEYVLASMPLIGPSIAKELLKKFGNIKNVVNADLSDLKSVNKLGEKKSKSLKELFEKNYNEEN